MQIKLIIFDRSWSFNEFELIAWKISLWRNFIIMLFLYTRYVIQKPTIFQKLIDVITFRCLLLDMSDLLVLKLVVSHMQRNGIIEPYLWIWNFIYHLLLALSITSMVFHAFMVEFDSISNLELALIRQLY